MQHKKLLIAGLVILLIIDLSLVYQSYKIGQAPNYETATARIGDISETVSVTGTAKPASQIDLQFTGSGKITDVKVKVGDKVVAGSVLVTQDSSDLVFQAQNAEAALQLAQAKLNQLLAGASAEDIAAAQTSVDNAQKSLDDAKKSLADAQASATNALEEDYQNAQRTLNDSLATAQVSLQTNNQTLDAIELNGILGQLNPSTLYDAKNQRTIASVAYNSASIAVANLETNFSDDNLNQAIEKLETTLNSISSALTKTYDALVATAVTVSVSQTDLDTYKSDVSGARTNANTALTNVTTAQQDISAQKITNQTNLNTGQAKVTTAEGSLEAAQNQLALKLAKPRQTDIDLYQAQVNQAKATLSQIRNQISQKSLIAPLDGIITDIPVEKGEIASASQKVISMNSLSNLEIESSIAETDIAKIKINDPVPITFDAFPDNEKWQGVVTKIDPAQTVVQGVVYYKTTVALASSDEKIKAGMTANLEIETAKHTGVLIIPRKAVTENGSDKTVQILEGTAIREQKVQTGIKSADGDIEIISGLQEGQNVVIGTK